MASSRKKQDEKNLKTLRELASLPQNKYCFDCGQRGPTYVNVTIGSFVCTKCSGMLRGLTPPHRVKSISMATFTNEEIDLLKKRGNDYCQKVWLGLHEGGSPQAPGGDETSIRDFMIEKYERRRYYLEPSKAIIEAPIVTPKQSAGLVRQGAIRARPEVRNGHHHHVGLSNGTTNGVIINGSGNELVNSFEVDFSTANIFNGSDGRTPPATNGNGFANFDNNPVFSNNTTGTTTTTSASPGMPPTNFPAINGWNNNNNGSNTFQNGSPQSVVDKYAALKDLDNEIKSQKNNFEWSSTSSNGSLYSSPTPPVSSPSPQSIFGSPSQGQFVGTFPLSSQENVSNPFNNGFSWGPSNGQQQTFSNPFRDTAKTNGFSQGFQPALFPVASSPMFVNGTNGWAQNPFKVGATTTMNSNNPFLS